MKTVRLKCSDEYFFKVYIPSDMIGFYEKCGFSARGTLKNYEANVDTIL